MASRPLLLAAKRSACVSSSRLLGRQSNAVASVCSIQLQQSFTPLNVRDDVLPGVDRSAIGGGWRLFSSRSSCPSRMEHNYESPASPKVEKVFEKILNLDMFEIFLVTELIAEKLGMNVNVGSGGVGGGGGGGGAKGGAAQAEEAEVEEKTAFDLKLVSFDTKSKIKVIKEVRSMAGLGLKEAKEIVEGAPKVVVKEIKKDEAEELKAKLEELGAVVEIV